MSQIIGQRLPSHPVGVLSGPNLAHEIATRHLTASVVASQAPQVRQLARDAFATRYFRLYSSEDLISVELGGALKNIYAIAAGLADGLGVGQNTKALLPELGISTSRVSHRYRGIFGSVRHLRKGTPSSPLNRI